MPWAYWLPVVIIPQAKGRLNAELTLRGSSSENLDIKGHASLNKLQLWGGPLGLDRPAVSQIDIQLDGTIIQSTLSLKQLRFQSSLASGSATGSFSNQGQKRLKGTADINLAEIFTQLPHTLKLREDTKLSRGKLVVSADVKSADGVTAFDSTARIDQITGVSKGKKLTWNKPISVKARGERNAQGNSTRQLIAALIFFKCGRPGRSERYAGLRFQRIWQRRSGS